MPPEWGTLRHMLFMVIERFKPGCASLIKERFAERGRLLPDAVVYHASWLDAAGTQCFQIMEAANLELLQTWARSWDDLIDFEFVRVLTSEDFWAGFHPGQVPMRP